MNERVPSTQSPELCNPRTEDDIYFHNTPVGVIITPMFSDHSGSDEGSVSTSVSITSQLIEGWWVRPDGSWTQESPLQPVDDVTRQKFRQLSRRCGDLRFGLSAAVDLLEKVVPLLSGSTSSIRDIQVFVADCRQNVLRDDILPASEEQS